MIGTTVGQFGQPQAPGSGGGGGGITEITSDDDTVTVTNPEGPTVDLSVPSVAGSWPTTDGTGSGNLQAETASDDTVGYQLVDDGTGGITLSTTNADAGNGIAIDDTTGGGVNISSTGTGGVSIQNNSTGSSMSIRDGSGETVQFESVGGMQIEDSSTNGLSITQDGDSDITITNSGGGDITFNATDGGGVVNPGLSTEAGHLASPYTVTASLATFLTTASLAVGKWLFMVIALTEPPSANNVEIEANVGTATATFEGVTSCEIAPGGSLTPVTPQVLTFIATVTVAGTLVFQAKGTSAGTIGSVTPTSSFAKATGYTAVKVG
jgi:hypothetical protein